MTVFLDSTPLGLLTQRPGVREANACKQWYVKLAVAGCSFLVPEIADYEVRRERARKSLGIARLDAFNAAAEGRYVALTTPVIRLAADQWQNIQP